LKRLWQYLGAPLINERGAALVITLFVVALVTILVLEYHFDAAVEVELADSYASDLQAYYLALSGLNFARAVLQSDTNGYDAADEPWALLGVVGCVPPQQLLALAREMGEAQESGASSLIDTEEVTREAKGEETTNDTEESEAAAACVRIQIVDEARKLPIPALLDANRCEINPVWEGIFVSFFEDFKIKENDVGDVINALADWMDTSCETPDGARSGGAEDDYYESLERPYTTPYLPMQVPGELRLVRYFTCEELAKLFPGKECKDVADLDLGSNDYLTPYGDSTAGARVNINTASEAVLRAITDNEACVAEEILPRRGVSFEGQLISSPEGPFQDTPNGLCDGVLRQGAVDILGVTSSHFRVEAVGEVGGLIKKKIVAVFSRSGQGNQTGGGPQMVYFKVE
jgi:type II secretory pathway component PulK